MGDTSLSVSQKNIEELLDSLNEGLPHIRSTYREVKNTLELQLDLLRNGLPYSIYAEYDLNFKLKFHIDICISNMNIIKKIFGKETFPLEHDLLRYYRGQLQHQSPSHFKPSKIGEKGDTDFYIWYVISQIEGAKDRFPDWCSKPNKITLNKLLDKNMIYVETLYKKVKQCVSGKNVNYQSSYPIGFAHSQSFISDKQSWLLGK